MECRLGNLGADKTVTVKIYVKPVVAGSYTNRAYVSYGSPTALGSDNYDSSDAAEALVARRP